MIIKNELKKLARLDNFSFSLDNELSTHYFRPFYWIGERFRLGDGMNEACRRLQAGVHVFLWRQNLSPSPDIFCDYPLLSVNHLTADAHTSFL